jgi:hypothetical protein
MQEKDYLEIGVGPKRGGALRKCGIREEVDESTAAAGFEVGIATFKLVRHSDGGVIGVNGDHDAGEGLCEGNKKQLCLLGRRPNHGQGCEEGIGMKRIG